MAFKRHLGQEDSVNSAFGFEWLRPEWWPALALGPVLFFLGQFGLRLRRRALAKLVAEHQVTRFMPHWSLSQARWRVLLAATGLAALVLALAGPVRGYTLRDVQRRGLDLVVCVDTSRSMLVEDLRPNRMARARREVRGLLQRLQGDRAALVAFAGDVRDVAPLTHDRATLSQFVEALSPRDNLVGGTDIGGALEHALKLFDGRTGAHEAVLLLTDGEDHGGRGLAVAEEAARVGIRIFIVGMATTGGGKIPLVDEAARGGGFQQDDDGAEVVSTLNGASLAAIAEATGGAYLAATDSPVPLEELYEKRISRMEARDLWAGRERVPHDRFQWALVIALVCMTAEGALGERRRKRNKGEVA
ncbi:MAG: VWA domain-containing protein [Planctomycetota bacterium]|nr:VWA domain-containing protein [Planctomycetota bacterium]